MHTVQTGTPKGVSLLRSFFDSPVNNSLMIAGKIFTLVTVITAVYRRKNEKEKLLWICLAILLIIEELRYLPHID